MQSVLKTFVACSVLAFGFALSASAGDSPQDVVVGPGKAPIRSGKYGNCVQTKWNSNSDVCLPAAAPVPAPRVEVPPAPQPVMRLAHEELTIYFPFNKSNITSESSVKLDNIADAVNHSPKVTKVNIVGYTDQIGSDSYNNRLSVKRALAAKAYLDTKMRIPAGVLGLRGLGKADPIAMGCSKIKKRQAKIECMAKDRRVEIEFQFEQ